MPKQYEWPVPMTDERQRLMAGVLWTVFEHGPIKSENGRATSLLLDLLKQQKIPISGGYVNKTLTDFEEGGVFGHFIDREVVGKRTYTIECIRKPGRDPFPPDPRRPVAAAAPGPQPQNTLLDLPEEDEFEDEDEETKVAGGTDETTDEILDLDLVPGMALEVVAPPSRVDRYLYMVSMLNEMITEEVTAPERDLEARLDSRLTAVNGILEENTNLKKRVEALEKDKRTLAQALEQANAMMRDLAARANGHQEVVEAVGS